MIDQQATTVVEEFLKKIVTPEYTIASSCISNVNWPAVIELATEQGVLGVIFDAIQELPGELRPDMDNLMDWLGQVSYQEELYSQHEHALCSLSDFYKSHGYKMMVLKGWGLSLNYPVPKHRPTGDLDIWMYGKQEEADKLLENEKGVQPIKSSHHTIFFYDGVEVENHITFIEVDCHKADGSEKILLKYTKDEPQKAISCLGSEILLPSPNFNAHFLLRHSTAHFSTERITLRHILDWAFFVNKHYQEINWESLYGYAKKGNMHVFLDCQNAICVEILGFPADRFPVRERHPKLEKRIFNDIIYPEFHDVAPNMQQNFIKYCYVKTKRHFANKWKYNITYKESFWSILWRFALNRIKDPYSFNDKLNKKQSDLAI